MITRMGNLVRLLDLDDDFIIDLKYATSDNFTGKKIYSSNECYVDANTAKLLIKAKDIFKKDGYKVKIWDAYRPLSAQARFWEIMPDPDFVAKPPVITANTKFRPTHMNGMCVDVTLTDSLGHELDMPSKFDDFTEAARLDCRSTEPERITRAVYMKDVMESVGFEGYDNEWWHFYDVKSEIQPFSDYKI